jgi:hypothetical protein
LGKFIGIKSLNNGPINANFPKVKTKKKNMTTYNFTNSGGFPLTQDVLKDIQDNANVANLLLPYVFGEPVIIAGFEQNTGGGYNAGSVFIPAFGLIPFEGSANATQGDRITVLQTTEPVNYSDGSVQNAKTVSKAVITTSAGPLTYAIAGLKKIENILNLKTAKQQIDYIQGVGQTQTLNMPFGKMIITRLANKLFNFRIESEGVFASQFGGYNIDWHNQIGVASFPDRTIRATAHLWEMQGGEEVAVGDYFINVKFGTQGDGGNNNFGISIPAATSASRVNFIADFVVTAP